MERGVDITRPRQHAEALAACPGAAYQVNNVRFAVCLEPIVKALRKVTRVAIAHFQHRTGVVAIVVKIIGAVFRFGFVQPEQLNAHVVVIFLHRTPDEFPRLRMGRIKEGGIAHKIEVDLHATFTADQPAFGFHQRVERAARLYRWPHRHHQRNTHFAQLVDHPFRIGPVYGVEAPGALIRPVEKVDDHHRQRQITAAILPRNLQHLLLGAVA